MGLTSHEAGRGRIPATRDGYLPDAKETGSMAILYPVNWAGWPLGRRHRGQRQVKGGRRYMEKTQNIGSYYWTTVADPALITVY